MASFENYQLSIEIKNATMKKFILFIFLLALPLIASAQIPFGYSEFLSALTAT